VDSWAMDAGKGKEGVLHHCEGDSPLKGYLIGGLSGGAVAGIAAGAVQGLSTAGLSYLSGAYGLGGLMAGVFSPLGKIAVAVAFVISNGIASLQVNGSTQVLYGAIEVAAASTLYMMIPQSRRLTNLFAVRHDRLPGDSLRKNVILRLRYASDAMLGASESVDKISKALQESAADDLPGVYGRAAEKVCMSCSQCAVCWRKNRDETQKSFSRLTYPLREHGRIDRSDFDVPFLTRCGRAGEIRDAVNGEYKELLAKESARMRAEQVRAVVEEHFRSTSQMLGDMAEEFEQYQHFDEESEEQAREVLRHHDLTPIEVCCRIDKFGRMTVEAHVLRTRGVHVNKGQLTRDLSAACGRTFAQPGVSASGERMRLQWSQKPVYTVQRGFAQHAAGGAAMCGDCAVSFTDGSGRYFSVLSDGMGTGGRAAVDGTMTASMAQSMLKAGIGFESTLRMINSAMLAKGGEESLATLDVVSIDLFTGETQLRKAGAAGTVLRRKKHSEYLEAKSAPVGILPEVNFARSEKTVSEGDIIVMVSDGVTAAGTEWLTDLVGSYMDD
ncbi:MAG: SpoIIE family protein phosphatase, partial [Clostridia bacterium]|nr:SpoIIE family protein phosphatase [Clostridia bacterium]